MNKIFTFLEKLEKHNNKKWMDEYRVYYEESRHIFKDLVQTMLDNIGLFDPQVSDQRVQDSLFYINRDQRFNKDNPPYKNYFSALISKEGRHSVYSGYYIHLQPGNKSFIGAGIYHPKSDILKKIRLGISEKGETLKEIIEQPHFSRVFGSLEGECLKRAPKEFNEDHQFIEFIKHKDFIVSREFKDHEVLGKNFISNLIQYCYYLKSFNHFFNNIILEPVGDKEYV